MSLAHNDLYKEVTRGPEPKIQPAEGPGAVQVRVFASGSGTLPAGTPVYVVAASGLMAKCDPSSGTANVKDLYGIVWPAAITLDSDEEVQGTVMLQGAIAWDELVALRAAGTIAGTLQQLKDMVRLPAVRYRGIVIEGLDKLDTSVGGLG